MKRTLVLIIESDADILHLMTMILEDANFDVIGMVNTPGLDFDFNPEIIILDIGPDNKGNQNFYENLRASKRTSNIPILLTSTLNGLENTAQQWKANGFFEKPFDIHHLINELVRATNNLMHTPA